MRHCSLILQDYTLHDPVLTDLGETQCRKLQEHLKANEPLADQVELIVVSPMRRTLQTAQLGLSWLIERGVPVCGLAEAQEYAEKPCDTGSDLAIIRQEYPFCDYSTVHPDWPSKAGLFAQEREAIMARGLAVRQWLQARPEKVIAVVSHSAILRISIVQARFANADYRIYDFTTEGGGVPFAMKQSARTLGKGGMGLSKEEPGGERPSDFPATK